MRLGKILFILGLCLLLASPLFAKTELDSNSDGYVDSDKLGGDVTFDSVTAATGTFSGAVTMVSAVYGYATETALQVYVDSSASDGGDGSKTYPYNTLSDLNISTGGANSLYDATHTDNIPAIVNLKYGSIFYEQINLIGVLGTVSNPIIFRAYGTPSDGKPIISAGDVIATFAGPDGNGEYTKASITTEPKSLIRINGDGEIEYLYSGTVGSLDSDEYAWSSDTLYLGFDPSTYTIEAAQRDWVFYTNGTGQVEIENIVGRLTNNDIFSFNNDSNVGVSNAILRDVEAYYCDSVSNSSDGITAHHNVIVRIYGFKSAWCERAFTFVGTVDAIVEDIDIDNCSYATSTNEGTQIVRRGTVDNTGNAFQVAGTPSGDFQAYAESITVTNFVRVLNWDSGYAPTSSTHFYVLRGIRGINDGTGSLSGVPIWAESAYADSRIYDSTFVTDAANNNNHVYYAVSGSKMTAYGNIFNCAEAKATMWLSSGAEYEGDYNDFYRDVNGIAAIWNGSAWRSLSQWQSDTGQDSNSFNVNPNFAASGAPQAASLINVSGYSQTFHPIRDSRLYIKPKVGTNADIGGVESGY